MYYVYVLRSKRDGNFYVGYTADLLKRMEHHNKGAVESTKNRRPFELIYYEACIKQQDALHREKYLKTAYGKRYIMNRLREYLNALD
jgi:putative endonuclease